MTDQADLEVVVKKIEGSVFLMLEGSIFRSANFVYTEHIHLLCLPTNEIIYETLSTAQFSAI